MGGAMKANRIALAAAAALLAATPLLATDARAEYKCDKPQGFIDARACAKAKEGSDVLRMFIQRTRMIYGLYFWDYVQPRDPSQRAGNERSAPEREAATVQRVRG